MRHVAALAIALCIASPVFADSNQPAAPWANRQLPDPAQERAARVLMESLRCLVCQGQSIADSDAELAGDMRSLVRERIARGEQPEAIRGWLVDRYGQWVSYAPRANADTALLFAAPLLMLVIGGTVAARRFRRRRTA